MDVVVFLDAGNGIVEGHPFISVDDLAAVHRGVFGGIPQFEIEFGALRKEGLALIYVIRNGLKLRQEFPDTGPFQGMRDPGRGGRTRWRGGL